MSADTTPTSYTGVSKKHVMHFDACFRKKLVTHCTYRNLSNSNDFLLLWSILHDISVWFLICKQCDECSLKRTVQNLNFFDLLGFHYYNYAVAKAFVRSVNVCIFQLAKPALNYLIVTNLSPLPHVCYVHTRWRSTHYFSS